MDLLRIPMMEDYIRIAADVCNRGWVEGSGGNLSMLLDGSFVELEPMRTIQTGFTDEALSGSCIVITGSGKYLKNIERCPEENLGILRIGNGIAELLWGFKGGASPSSELLTHLRVHAARKNADSAHRVLIHVHATNMVAMSMVHPLDEKLFTQTLWSIMTECFMTFPDGIAILPWMLPGGDEIAVATANKMRSCRLALWAHHGVICAGSSPDDALGLIGVVEKAAELCIKTAHLPLLSRIESENLVELSEALGIRPRQGLL